MATICFLKRCVLTVPLVLMLAAANAAPYTVVFGPQKFTRSTGAPETITKNFARCGNSPCQIVVANGAANGSNRVSSASVFLNGSPIIGPSDFNRQSNSIVRPVTLRSRNVLAVRLASSPGSFLNITLQCAASFLELSARAPGVSLESPGSLLSAVNIVNEGAIAAKDVKVTSISLNGGNLTSPVLPRNLGTIPANRSAVLNANFSGAGMPFAPGRSYTLTVDGTYTAGPSAASTRGSSTYCFTVNEDLTIPPAAPGSADLKTATVKSASVTGGRFPSRPPKFGTNVNRQGWTVPTGPFIPLDGPVSSGTNVQKAPGSMPSVVNDQIGLVGGPPAIDFVFNSGLGLTSAGVGCSGDSLAACAEPSGAVTGGGVVFATANWSAAYSTDGINFKALDPTKIFPDDAIGFCCDQIVQYVPSIDRFVWLLQGTGYRLAIASPSAIINSNGTAWTYWNLTPALFGAAGVGLDYPDLSAGNNFLYLSWNGKDGLQVARVPLSGTNSLQGAGTITIGYTDPAKASMAWGSHLTQNTGDEIFWAGHNKNSNMRIFSLKENSNTYFWRDRGISSWANNAPTSLTPDGRDWLAKNFNGQGGNSFPKNGVIGSTRVGNQLWFAWSAGTDSRFKQAHVEMVTFDRNNDFKKVRQVQIWNNDYAFAYPALATNACTGEVGLSFEYGGNSKYYENHVVGFWGDFIAYSTTGSNAGTTRYGDYVTIRQATPSRSDPGNLFAAFGWAVNKATAPSTGLTTDVHYVLFGRPPSSCAIILR
ncbi:hypothetical protein [Methylobacter sp. BlB1]|uniref:hypothetical protein n=1 Tax=Methylobacter sp. BlB1 TaxID=2785914 RepID=UPI0018935E3B|nr:hypothetical protein [Methylobacter sp. BlB1]MBF6651086.1 hypothetical protein [Methylobacter sp. BlB1]